MQSVGGDDSKEADIPDKWAPIKSYAPWKPHKLLKIGQETQGVGVQCETLNQEACTLFPAHWTIYGQDPEQKMNVRDVA